MADRAGEGEDGFIIDHDEQFTTPERPLFGIDQSVIDAFGPRAEEEAMELDVNRAKRGPDRSYQVGETRFGRYGWRHWEASRHGKGVGGCWTPWGALFRQRRWEKKATVPL